ncbi:MAG: response regulator [Gammaproteobacteria bacterium]|nr:response regulator [Gammaproteobacteria bacterium]
MNEPAGASGTVLIADDDPMTRALVRGSLEQLGYKVEEAADGLETLEALSQYKPDILLLDIKMPGMDGIETLKKLRKRPDGKDLPVIMLTGLADSDSAAKAAAAGATDYVTKPINWRLLGQRIRHQLHLNGRIV